MGRLARKLREAGKLPPKKPREEAPAAPQARSPKAAAPARRRPPEVAEGNLSIPQWTEYIQQYPDFTQAYVERGVLLYKTGRMENAIYDFNMALKLEPSNAKALYWRGCVYMNYSKFREAVADFKKAVPHDKGADVCAMAGFALERTGDLDGALAMLQKALQRDPAHVKALGLRGEILVRRRRYDEALEDLTKAIEADPRNADALAARAQVSLFRGNFGKALEDINAALKINPKLAQAHHDRGVIAMKRRDFAAAIENIERAVQIDSSQPIDPRYAEAYLARGMERFKANKLNDAIADFQSVERLNPDVLPRAEFADALRRRAVAELEANQLDAAVRDFEGADGLRPAEVSAYHVEARYRRGIARAARGDHDGALADLEWSLGQRADKPIDPAFGASFGDRGKRRQQVGQYAEAIADLTRAIALVPKETSFRDARGRCYFELEDFDRAAADFELLRRMNPAAEMEGRLFGAFVHRAKARLQHGDVVGAVGDFEVAVANDAAFKQDPAYVQAYTARCAQLLKEQKHEAALADWERVTAVKSDAPAPAGLHLAYCARAQARHSRNKTDLAMNDLARAVKLAPNDAQAYAVRGRILVERMDYADAAKELEQALKLDPSRKDDLGPLLDEARQAMK